MEYTNEEYIFRDGATPGFHEGIGNAMPMAITTPHHMECTLNLDLGFNTNCIQQPKQAQPITPEDINFLYSVALEKVTYFMKLWLMLIYISSASAIKCFAVRGLKWFTERVCSSHSLLIQLHWRVGAGKYLKRRYRK